jgi:UDP-N-acetylglucosamine 2-epimerase
MIGNSSAAIRESAFLGVPAVNVGTRQEGRQRGSNVIDVGYNNEEILGAIQTQIRNGRYPSEEIYGDGHTGARIAKILATCKLTTQKRLTY